MLERRPQDEREQTRQGCDDEGESIFSLKETLRHSSLDLTYRYARAMQTTGDAGAALLMDKFADL